MKKIFVFPLFFALLLMLPGLSFGQEDITKHQACKYCGMDRGKFDFSRIYLEYDDGSSVGTCSIHCAAVDLALTTDKTPSAIMVADYNTRQLIEAEKAFWVLGGEKPGVMTRRAKWAFANKADAETFVKEKGGSLITFDAAMKAAYEDMYQDTRMIRDKRRMMKQKGMTEHKH